MAAVSKRFEVRRDYAATVISVDDVSGTKHLLVNGFGMTSLMNATKYMASLPLMLHEGKPESALVICFGMGTSYRSALNWGIEATTVELVPDVPSAFGFYHADAAEVLRNPNGRIVIDDGRRFLDRTREKYDVIIVDPPPPVEAAGSSLLYSTEMYALMKRHLKPHGIVQVWCPGGPDLLLAQAVLRSAVVSFPCVRAFTPIDERGIHILASMDPIEKLTPAQLIARMPNGAKQDLLEWSKTKDLSRDLATVLSHEIVLETFLNSDPEIRITDDDPINEYFLLRRAGLL